MTPMEAILRSMHAGTIITALRFLSQDRSPDEFYLIDCRGHIDCVPCAVCGTKPKMFRSTEAQLPPIDDYEFIALGCSCFRSVRLSVLRSNFSRSCGPIRNALGSWWNSWQAPDYHPDDFKAAGGIIVASKIVQEYLLEKKYLPAEERLELAVSDAQPIEPTPEPTEAPEEAEQ